MDTTTVLQKGGAWLIEDAAPSAVFTPERMSDEQRMIGYEVTHRFYEIGTPAALEEARQYLARVPDARV